jgi:hypothetical protein
MWYHAASCGRIGLIAIASLPFRDPGAHASGAIPATGGTLVEFKLARRPAGALS